ncbi:low molecular weight phosphotyrosine protein phosphatase [Akkermansiaceae bacterium]|nr:low molecular weight phosphotyrosine protein phosphatase [Akkermansiaceae bacterium]
MKRVLFICMGNICRSPAAEIVFRKMVGGAGLDAGFEIDSAGTIGYHKGSPPDPRMAAHLAKRGYVVEGRSRQLTADDLRDFDILLTMDEENLADTLALDPSGNFHHKVKPFVGFLEEHEASQIPDPYYGGNRGFARVIDLLEDGCRVLLERLAQRED